MSNSRSEEAVSEVVGFLVTFGIIALLLIAAMLTFNTAQERAQNRVAAIQVDSIAQRVAGSIVEGSLFLESQCNANPPCPPMPTNVKLSLLLELPPDLQGNGYQVKLSSTSVMVTSTRASTTQSLFGVAGTGSAFNLCSTAGTIGNAASGGDLYVTYNFQDAAPCLGVSNSPVT